MKYRITERDAFRVFGVYTNISTEKETAFAQVPEFCRKCDEDLVTDEMNELLGRFDDNYTMSALYDFTKNSCKYMLCQFLPKGLKLPEKYTVLDVPSGTWAVFDVPNCDMQAVWSKIGAEDFNALGYEKAEGINFEMYYGLARHENGYGEIWIPVKKK